MTTDWPVVAQRIVDALSLEPGMLVQLGERSGRPEVLAEILLALERRGATPLIEYLPPDYLGRLLASTDPGMLANWDRHRLGWLERADRLLVLGGDYPDFDATPPEALNSWRQATERLTRTEEERRLPMVLVAIPTASRAERLGVTFDELESIVLPAIAATPEALQREIDRVLPHLLNAGRITIGNPDGSTLELELKGRPGTPTPESSRRHRRSSRSSTCRPGRSTRPSSRIAPQVASTSRVPATPAMSCSPSRQGRIVSIQASEGSDELATMFDQHSGEPRRISHIGIGLNPELHREVDWVLVDEHRLGSLFIAFGENRYLGGQNVSSLNVDFVTASASLYAGDRLIVGTGRVVV